MALTHWASEGDTNTHLDKGHWTGDGEMGREGELEGGGGGGGESAAVMMCCRLAGRRCGSTGVREEAFIVFLLLIVNLDICTSISEATLVPDSNVPP